VARLLPGHSRNDEEDVAILEKMNLRAALRLGLLAAAAVVTRPEPARSAPECRPTEPDTQGPFYLPGAPTRIALAAPDEPGDRLVVRGRVLHPDCRTPLAGTLLDVWQADASGRYHGATEQYRLRGRLRTDSTGSWELTTIRPGNYRLGAGMRPAHLHFLVTHPAHPPLVTQLYFRDDPYLGPHDACGAACKSGDPHRVIGLAREEIMGGEVFVGRFDVVLGAGA
jgi:catechol 1,2-dioxygenase